MMKSLGKRYSTLKNSKKKGFTLIEIVVVIAIMAILALILVPNLTAWVQKGDETKVKANMKSVHTAAELVRQTEGSLIEERIKTFSNNEDVIVSEGVIADEDLEADKYTVTNKGGQTVVKYKTQDGKVFAFPDVSNVNNGGSGESEDPTDIYLATDDGSYIWVTNESGYFSTNKNHGGKGYYRYIGEDTEVVIPHIIHGHKMTSYFYMFAETNVKKVVSNNPNITNMYGMFIFSQATTLDLSSLDTSKVTTMEEMFYNSKAKTLDLSKFDTSQVTNMKSMFQGSEATTLDLSNFNTSQVTTMEKMFDGSQATTLDLSNFNTSQVTTMEAMFSYSQAANLDLSSFNTSKVTTMYGMFMSSQVKSLDLSSFNTSKVISMYAMFWGSQATTLDLSSFDTSNVTDMGRMFHRSLATAGYARTQADANKLNASSNKPSRLSFTVK